MGQEQPIVISDSRLTPDLKRYRSGSTMLFYKPGNRSLQAKDADIVIKAPRRELYAGLINDEWCWINGCPECLGEEPNWPYSKCEKHNVCIECGTPRSKLKELPWGCRKGFTCAPCATAKHEAEKAAALAKFEAADHDESYFHFNNEIVCPHCALATPPHDGPYEEDTQVCKRCDGEYIIEPDCTWSYSTSMVGERVTGEGNGKNNRTN